MTTKTLTGTCSAGHILQAPITTSGIAPPVVRQAPGAVGG